MENEVVKQALEQVRKHRAQGEMHAGGGMEADPGRAGEEEAEEEGTDGVRPAICAPQAAVARATPPSRVFRFQEVKKNSPAEREG